MEKISKFEMGGAGEIYVRLLIDSISKRRWNMVEHTLSHLEKLYNTILEEKDYLDDLAIN